MIFARREMRPITLIAAAAMLLVCMIALLELQNNRTQNQLVVQQSHLLDQKSVLVELQTRLFIERQNQNERLSKPPEPTNAETGSASLQDSASLLHLQTSDQELSSQLQLLVNAISDFVAATQHAATQHERLGWWGVSGLLATEDALEQRITTSLMAAHESDAYNRFVRIQASATGRELSQAGGLGQEIFRISERLIDAEHSADSKLIEDLRLYANNTALVLEAQGRLELYREQITLSADNVLQELRNCQLLLDQQVRSTTSDLTLLRRMSLYQTISVYFLVLALISAAIIIELRRSRRLHGRVRQLAAGMSEVGNSPTPVIRRPLPEGTDEIGTLSSTFRSMVRRIQRQVSTIEGERQRAEEAGQAKSRFLANMSHELRTPMNGIFGVLQLLESATLSPREHELIRTARSSADALLRLINNVLDLSKLDANRMVIERQIFDPVALIEDTVSLLGPSVHARGVALICDLDPSFPRSTWGDPHRLRQVLINLLGNADRFTEHGEILLQAQVDFTEGRHAQLAFSVVDTGIGISPDVLPHLFEPFTQADSSTSRQYGGTGLGLAISHDLVAAMGGELWAVSTPGEGSTFGFSLILERNEQPQSKSPNLRGAMILVIDPVQARRAVLQSVLLSWGAHCQTVGAIEEATEAVDSDYYTYILCDKSVENINELDVKRTILMVTNEPEAHDFSGVLYHPIRIDALAQAIQPQTMTMSSKPLQFPASRRVLLVEDHPINQMVAHAMLEQQGIQAVLARDGIEAIHAIEREPFDLVLMDCQMPRMDGFEATTAIRRREAHTGARLPVIAMTANDSQDDHQRCRDAGMDGLLSKPVRTKELQAVLQRWLMEEYEDEPSISGQPSPLTESVEATEQVQIG
jgi:signal transduction histidine kinase/DNA-binding response OmpR family regulator